MNEMNQKKTNLAKNISNSQTNNCSIAEYDRYIISVASGNLVSTSLLTSLIEKLIAKGVLHNEDVRDIYEHALYQLETQQSATQGMASIYKAARETIEAELSLDTSA